MKIPRPMMIAGILLPISVGAYARAGKQNHRPGQKPSQDGAAVVEIQAALASLGGAANIALIQNSVVQGTSVPVPPDGTSGNFTWTYAGSEFINVNQWAEEGHTLYSNGGAPCDVEGNATVFDGSQVARANLPFHVPGVALLSELNDLNYSLTYVGLVTVIGGASIEVQTVDNSDFIGQTDTPQNWYFDPNTAMPLRVEYRAPSGNDPNTWIPASIDFADFQTINGVLTPFQLTMSSGSTDAAAISSGTITSVVFNSSITQGEFSAGCGDGQ